MRSNRLTVAPQASDDVFERTALRQKRSVVHAEPVQAAPVTPVYKDFDEAPDWPQDRIVREFGNIARARNKLISQSPEQTRDDFNNILAELFGLGGKRRLQTWPERMAVSAATFPRDAVTGAEPMGGVGERFPIHAIERAQEVAGLSGGAPLMAKPGSATLGSGAVRAGAKEVKAEPFYSAVEAAVRNAPDAKMTPEQWSGYLRNRPGVKAEELDWIGLPEGQKISKQEMLDHAKEHGVQMKEIKKDGKEPDSDRAPDDWVQDTVREYLEEAVRQWEDQSGKSASANRVSAIRRGLEVDIRQNSTDFGWEPINGGPKFGPDTHPDLSLPGGNNYREVLFTLPVKETQGLSDWYKTYRKPQDPVRFYDLPPDLQAKVEQIYTEAKRTSPGNYQSSHWDEPNVLAHVRVNDRLIPEGPQGKPRMDWTEAEIAKEVNERVLAKDSEAKSKYGVSWETMDEPTKASWRDYLRNEVEPKGLKTLHLEEVQSDWHQAGRKQGYKEEVTSEQRNTARNKATATYKTLDETMAAIEDKTGNRLSAQKMNNVRDKIEEATSYEEIGALAKFIDMDTPEFIQAALAHNEAAKGVRDLMRKQGGVPDAPFKTSWPDLVFKRMIREAAENGYDAVSWTPGEVQAARYDLSKQVKSVNTVKNPDGTYRLDMFDLQGNHHSVPNGKAVPENKLADYVGKDLAERITQNNGGIFEGADLKVGGEGMKGFYDDMLIRKANALGKKYGAKVEWEELANEGKQIVVERSHGQPDKFVIYDNNGNQLKQFTSKAEAEQFKKESVKVPVFRLTPELRDVAMRKGFPLFSAGIPYPLVPIDHDPFKETK